MRERNVQVFSLVSDEHPGAAVDVFAAEPFDFDTEHAAAMVAQLAPGLEVPFVRLDTLIAMKEARDVRGSGRRRAPPAHPKGTR